MEDRLIEIFLSKIKVNQESGCWNWGGNICPSTLYGRLQVNGKRYLTHRISYSLFNGELIKGLMIDHKCRNRDCVNPEHLRQVTPKVNTLENSKSLPAINSSKTHCLEGHELGASRRCDICQKRMAKDWESRNRSHRNAYSRNQRKLKRDISVL